MTKRTSVIVRGMAAVVALAAGSASAQTTPLYAGGSTLVEKAYRDLFNSYGNTSAGDLCAGRSTCPTTHYRSNVELLYVGVGSGNGLKALDNHDASLYVSGSKKPDAVPTPSGADFGTFYGTGTGTGWTPGTGVGPNYPKVSFSGSDNTLGSADVATTKTVLGNNPLIQLPGLVAAIAVPFHPTAGWNPKGIQPVGGSSKVQLSLNTLCGIYNGDIKTWNDPAITKDNKGVKLGTGTITVAYRNDSSGTTFIFTNALLNQCGVTAFTGTNGTVTASTTKSTHPIPGQWVYDNSNFTFNASAPHYKSGTSFFINAFNAGHLPANFLNDTAVTGVTGGANGSGGMRTAINTIVGSIGYVSPDFVLPVDKTGPATANLQTYATFAAGTTPVYRAPTAANAIFTMSSTKPPAFPTAAANPLNWGAVNPLPAVNTAYPISGFSFIDLYRCYKSAVDVDALAGTTAGKVGYLTWYYGAKAVNGGTPAAVLAADGFAPVPTVWATAINKLLSSSSLGLSTPLNGSCKFVAVKNGA